ALQSCEERVEFRRVIDRGKERVLHQLQFHRYVPKLLGIAQLFALDREDRNLVSRFAEGNGNRDRAHRHAVANAAGALLLITSRRASTSSTVMSSMQRHCPMPKPSGSFNSQGAQSLSSGIAWLAAPSGRRVLSLVGANSASIGMPSALA